MSVRHPLEQDLALYAAGDLAGLARLRTSWHVRGCGECSTAIEAFRMNRYEMEDALADLPPGIDWSRLESEMTANIRLGLAAGECVATTATPGRRELMSGWNWRPAAAVAALVLVFGAAWWLNMPHIAVGHPSAFTVVEASADGLAGIHEKSGAYLGLAPGDSDSQPGDAIGPAPAGVKFDVNFSGSASVRLVNDDAHGVTETTVEMQQ